MKSMRIITALFCVFISTNTYAERTLPKKPKLKKINVRFNNDHLKASYLLIDVRSEEQKSKNETEGKLDGPVLIFFHGHSQRPEDGYMLTSKLALYSKSGILLVPICQTPTGKDRKWRGDDGKDIILMEIIRYALKDSGIYAAGYKPISEMKVYINEKEINSVIQKSETSTKSHIKTKFALLGWSHGAILSRRIAHHYPNSTVSMAHLSPAGYEKWDGAAELIPAFGWECARISGRGIAKGEFNQSIHAGNAVSKGLFSDIYGSLQSCIFGNFSLAKPFRPLRDADDCAAYLDDWNYPVQHLNMITVIFSEKDSLFEYKKAGIPDPKKITARDIDDFINKYYHNVDKKKTGFSLHVLPGNHIGPYVFPDEYAKQALIGIAEFREKP